MGRGARHDVGRDDGRRIDTVHLAAQAARPCDDGGQLAEIFAEITAARVTSRSRPPLTSNQDPKLLQTIELQTKLAQVRLAKRAWKLSQGSLLSERAAMGEELREFARALAGESP